MAAGTVVVGAARTPFGKFGGSLRDFSLPDLGSIAVQGALERSGLAPEDVDELGFGINLPGSDRSIARQVLLRTGIPSERVAYSVDRACCSALAAISIASRSLRLEEATVAVAGGVENLSRIPYFLESARWGNKLGDIVLKDQLVLACPHTHVPRAVQAAEEAKSYGVERAEQDEWALRSQVLFAAAEAAGKVGDEIVAVPLNSQGPPGSPALFAHDECPRPDTTLEALAALPTVYGSSTVTAGNAPGLSTGGAAVVLTTPKNARRRGLEPLATIRSTAMVSGEPARIASIPAVAARAALKRANVSLDDVSLIEINEAFAAVPVVATLQLAGSDGARAKRIREKTNVNGGAIAVGHPTGATGGRLVATIIGELRRRGGGIGLVTMCGGIGEGEALVLEV